MRAHLFAGAVLSAATVFGVHLEALAQAAPLAPGQVSGAELQTWLDADGLALGGISLQDRCQFLAKNKSADRHLSIICPNDLAPWTVKGEGKVVGNRWCSKFRFPNGTTSDTCEEFFKIGDNRYELRVDGQAKHRVHRLIP